MCKVEGRLCGFGQQSSILQSGKNVVGVLGGSDAGKALDNLQRLFGKEASSHITERGKGLGFSYLHLHVEMVNGSLRSGLAPETETQALSRKVQDFASRQTIPHHLVAPHRE